MSKDGGSKQATAEKRLIEKDPKQAISFNPFGVNVVLYLWSQDSST